MKFRLKFYHTAIHYAVKNGELELVKLLLQNDNINIDVKDEISTLMEVL